MRPPRVELLCVGTELLAGKVNTHASRIPEKLEPLGLSLARETTVGDDPAEMFKAFAEAAGRADVVLCAGGLGPTFDDITRNVWSRVLGRPLRFSPSLCRAIERRFKQRKIRMSAENRRQAYVLTGAVVMPNRGGTAPGQILRHGKKTIALFPGPERELFPMFDEYCAPLLKTMVVGARLRRVWSILGIPESSVDERLDGLRRAEGGRGAVKIQWGILAQRGVVDIKATVAAGSEKDARAVLDRIGRRVHRLFGLSVFAEDGLHLEEVVGKFLRERQETLALAESCTGGLLAEKITRVPGSSRYLTQGFVTYTDASKRRLLGVGRGLLKKHGAVSRECVTAMAEGCLKRSLTHWAAAISGIAGPEGGSPGKPVGTVWVAVTGRGRPTRASRLVLPGDRASVREGAALHALDLLRRALTAPSTAPRCARS